MLVLPVGAAVNEQHHRDRRSGLEISRLGEKSVHVGAVAALELDVFGRHQVKLGDPRIIMFGQLAKRAVFQRIDLGGLHIIRIEHGGVSGLGVP